jgi:hypothetical protein
MFISCAVVLFLGAVTGCLIILAMDSGPDSHVFGWVSCSPFSPLHDHGGVVTCAFSDIMLMVMSCFYLDKYTCSCILYVKRPETQVSYVPFWFFRWWMLRDVAMWCFISCFSTSVVTTLLIVVSWKFHIGTMSCLNVVWYLVVCVV